MREGRAGRHQPPRGRLASPPGLPLTEKERSEKREETRRREFAILCWHVSAEGQVMSGGLVCGLVGCGIGGRVDWLLADKWLAVQVAGWLPAGANG